MFNKIDLNNKININIVWLKRDLRTQDHYPLYMAEKHLLPYIIIYLFEPSIYTYADTSIRHLQFQYQSILSINKKLHPFKKEVIVFHTEAISALSALQEQFNIHHIFSYQESGIQLTYERDKSVSLFCKEHEIIWKQYQRDGILRGLKNRDGWDKKWYATMHSSIIVNNYSIRELEDIKVQFPIPNELMVKLKDYPASFQPAGEEFAYRYLQDFLNGRGKYYSKHISKPLESRTSCARISPYLSWGNMSIKQVYQYANHNLSSSNFKSAIKSFLVRLKWHCHFIQKFEVDCSYENKCINSGYELLLHIQKKELVDSWKKGETGYPLIDACMKCLEKTGWINFRMRAMLVSFFCHHLYQDWRLGTYHLAQLFLDYDPGIHYPQFQMQAGTTGINTIRMYNPIKQSLDHDPNGIFIKKWLPQLKEIPEKFIHEPYKMSLMEQHLYHVIIGKDYPKPIVNLEEAGKIARDNIWGHRKNELVKEENKRIINTHTRRKQIKKSIQ